MPRGGRRPGAHSPFYGQQPRPGTNAFARAEIAEHEFQARLDEIRAENRAVVVGKPSVDCTARYLVWLKGRDMTAEWPK